MNTQRLFSIAVRYASTLTYCWDRVLRSTKYRLWSSICCNDILFHLSLNSISIRSSIMGNNRMAKFISFKCKTPSVSIWKFYLLKIYWKFVLSKLWTSSACFRVFETLSIHNVITAFKPLCQNHHPAATFYVVFSLFSTHVTIFYI